MQKIYYIFISIITILTIFITLLSGENSAYNLKINKYYWPTPNFYGISSYFGYRNKPTIGASTYHKGIDILANQGSGVSAIDDGIVKFASFDSFGGYMITIEHKNNTKSFYMHLDSKMYVKPGDSVKKGDIIGKVGPKYIENGKLNGATTGVHLHLGISVKGEYVDPLYFFSE